MGKCIISDGQEHFLATVLSLVYKIFFTILYKMNYIRTIKNLNINDKAKTKEQHEIIINVSMQEIKRLELYIILQEEI